MSASEGGPVVEVGRDCDLRIAREVFGLDAKWWSLHEASSWDAYPEDRYGLDWTHTASSMMAKAHGGWPVWEVNAANGDGALPIVLEGPFGNVVKHYSTDRSAALEVVDRLTAAGLNVDLLLRVHAVVEVAERHEAILANLDTPPLTMVSAPSLPLAICRAALAPEVLSYLRSRVEPGRDEP